MAVYEGNWKDYTDLTNEYGYKKIDGFPAEQDIVFAGYETPSYEGYALIMFWKDGKLYEVNDSHCSCYGLENWKPEETSKEALLMRKTSWKGLKEALDVI